MQQQEAKTHILDLLCLNCLTYLNNHDQVAMVQVVERNSVSSTDILQWEQLNYPLKLPTDLRNFLCVTDGIWIRWRAKYTDFTESDPTVGLPIGNIHINSLSQLKLVNIPVQSLQYQLSRRRRNSIQRSISLESIYNSSNIWEESLELVYDENTDSEPDDLDSDLWYNNENGAQVIKRNITFPSIINLDEVCNYGRICLVYEDPNCVEPQVWFEDISCNWHYIAPSFKAYFRLLIVHLGIFGWQYIFTDIGCDEICRNWLRLFAYDRYVLNNQHVTENDFDGLVIPDLLMDDYYNDNDNDNEDDDNYINVSAREAINKYRNTFREFNIEDVDKELAKLKEIAKLNTAKRSTKERVGSSRTYRRAWRSSGKRSSRASTAKVRSGSARRAGSARVSPFRRTLF